MTLAQYLHDHEITQAEFAALVRASQGTVSKLCNGGKRPGWGLAARIEKATGGKVPLSAWVKAEQEIAA